MKSYPYYQVNAFTNSIYGGNPAAVCPLEQWLPDEVMQQLAKENNLSETAFFIQHGDDFHIRWFTPEMEIDLAGHPTLATAFVIFNEYKYNRDVITFHSKSGLLYVRMIGNKIELNFPSRMPHPTHPALALMEGFSHQPQHIYKSRDYVLVYKNEEELKNITPDFIWLNRITDALGIICTAPSSEPGIDFVSRFFVPNSVIEEDPVTGSAHATLIPFWSKQLNKKTLVAKQISKRTGTLWCEDLGDRVTISGQAILYLKGEYFIY
jgi:PhzF family phenazine biosynthesis protein